MGRSGFTVRGLSQFIGRLHTIKNETAEGMVRGLKKAGLFLQAKSQKIVPVDTGNLKNSAFTRVEGSGFTTRVKVGYTANYAIYVHENETARHKPRKYAKFLERPAKEFRDEMIKIIRTEAKKGRRGGRG